MHGRTNPFFGPAVKFILRFDAEYKASKKVVA